MPRWTSFNNTHSELSKLVPATLKRLRAERDKLYPPAAKVQQFTATCIHADGSTFTFTTSMPRNRVIMVKDTTNHPIWNPRVSLLHRDTTSEEFSKFNRKMARSGLDEEALASLADIK
ncbi:hypothetical protein MP638_002217 [Amoeboaphelidium occidentale]|nr:hypothetical protein MP638_002217 [Amoeboaphelidium occidentale]